MIETKEQWEEIKLDMEFIGDEESSAYKRGHVFDTIEALREWRGLQMKYAISARLWAKMRLWTGS